MRVSWSILDVTFKCTGAFGKSGLASLLLAFRTRHSQRDFALKRRRFAAIAAADFLPLRCQQRWPSQIESQSLPGKPVAFRYGRFSMNCGLLWLFLTNYGLLEDIVAYDFGLLGSHGTGLQGLSILTFTFI